MKQIRFAFLAGLLCLLAGCGKKEAAELQVYSYNDTVYAMVSQGDSSLYFEADDTLPAGAVIFDVARCKDSLTKVPILHFYSDLVLPVPTSHETIADRINDTLMHIVLEANQFTDEEEWPHVFRPKTSPELLLKELCQKLTPVVFNNSRGLPYQSPFIFSAHGQTPLIADEVMTYRLDFEQYISHAAHGYYFSVYKVFSLKSGLSLRESDLFDLTPANRNAINALLRKAYEELAAGDTTGRYGAESGWWPDSIAMNGNFGILERSIVYHYNPYEAGCYAAGDLNLEILSYKLEPYLKKNTVVYKYWHK